MIRELLPDPGVRDDECAADDVGVAAAVLGGRVHDDVGAQGERLLEVRRGEGVVDDQERGGAVSDACEHGDVSDGQQRVGGVSTQTTRVRGCSAACTDAGSDMSAAVHDTPHRWMTLLTSRYVPP